MMTHKEKYLLYFNTWKIIMDYVMWVKNGGEAFYGSSEVAEVWAEHLLLAQNEEMMIAMA